MTPELAGLAPVLALVPGFALGAFRIRGVELLSWVRNQRPLSLREMTAAVARSLNGGGGWAEPRPVLPRRPGWDGVLMAAGPSSAAGGWPTAGGRAGESARPGDSDASEASPSLV